MINLSQILFVEIDKKNIILRPSSPGLFSEHIIITNDTDQKAKEMFEKLAEEFAKK